MNDYTAVTLRRNRGWPWPESSWGLDPMYGPDGWCHSCGVPKHPQTGSIVLQRRGMGAATGGWVPNWQFDVYCLEARLAAEVADRFGVGLREVNWSGKPPGQASQIVIASTLEPWFDPCEITPLIEAAHGQAFEICPVCGATRWLPVGFETLPLPPSAVLDRNPPVVASPEWFGAGRRTFRQILWRHDLAEFLIEAGPRDFRLGPVVG